MTEDAKFEDGGPVALSLRGSDADDLKVISAMVQDAILPASEIRWEKADRRFAALINRFCWERETDRAQRVQSALVFEDVLRSEQDGLGDPADLVLSILSIDFEPSQDGTGTIRIHLAGNGEIKLEVECVDVVLRDVTKPYYAPSGKTPSHPE